MSTFSSLSLSDYTEGSKNEERDRSLKQESIIYSRPCYQCGTWHSTSGKQTPLEPQLSSLKHSILNKLVAGTFPAKCSVLGFVLLTYFKERCYNPPSRRDTINLLFLMEFILHQLTLTCINSLMNLRAYTNDFKM